jgi:hypothetical protein
MCLCSYQHKIEKIWKGGISHPNIYRVLIMWTKMKFNFCFLTHYICCRAEFATEPKWFLCWIIPIPIPINTKRRISRSRSASKRYWCATHPHPVGKDDFLLGELLVEGVLGQSHHLDTPTARLKGQSCVIFRLTQIRIRIGNTDPDPDAIKIDKNLHFLQGFWFLTLKLLKKCT